MGYWRVMMENTVVFVALILSIMFTVRRIFRTVKGEGVSCCAGEGEGCGPCSSIDTCEKGTESWHENKETYLTSP
jgi:hypothetical protein